MNDGLWELMGNRPGSAVPQRATDVRGQRSVTGLLLALTGGSCKLVSTPPPATHTLLFFPWITSHAINPEQPRGLYLKCVVGNTLCLVALNAQGTGFLTRPLIGQWCLLLKASVLGKSF